MMETPGSKPTDELIRRAIIGDGTAFTELWDTHIGSLRSYLRSAMKHLDDFYIDDICSRSFEKAFRQIRSFDPARSQFSTWLRRIAHNTALDTIDAETRSQSRLVSLDKESAGSGQIIDTIGDESATPLEQIVEEEDAEKLEGYVEGLPDLYRTIARMRLVDGLQYKEIAEELGMELNTVRTRIRRAKAMVEAMKADD
ncbi:MAG: RNA polymerase sigma factor [Bacteroidales bacterium]|nr:RNA polymerase sigma factor [Bacteroidales bacterium]